MRKQNKIAAIITAGALVMAAGSPALYAESKLARSAEETTDQAARTVKDAWLDGKLESALLFNEHLNSFDIDTEVVNRIAYLSGAVESDIDRDLAEEIAKSIKGVSDVRNNLVVDGTKARDKQDNEGYAERDTFKHSVMNATLTARVKTQLLLNDNTSGLSINVDSKNGGVTLTGKVKSAAEKELAERIAANTDGAHNVLNQLVVGGQ